MHGEGKQDTTIAPHKGSASDERLGWDERFPMLQITQARVGADDGCCC